MKGNSSLKFWPPVTLANIVKRKDWVFALLNCEIIEAMWGQLIGSDGTEKWLKEPSTYTAGHKTL